MTPDGYARLVEREQRKLDRREFWLSDRVQFAIAAVVIAGLVGVAQAIYRHWIY